MLCLCMANNEYRSVNKNINLKFTATFLQYVADAEEILEVKSQVGSAVDLSILVQKLQEERAAVALSAFLNRSNTMDSMQDLQPFVLNELDISRFTLLQVNTKCHLKWLRVGEVG